MHTVSRVAWAAILGIAASGCSDDAFMTTAAETTTGGTGEGEVEATTTAAHSSTSVTSSGEASTDTGMHEVTTLADTTGNASTGESSSDASTSGESTWDGSTWDGSTGDGSTGDGSTGDGSTGEASTGETTETTSSTSDTDDTGDTSGSTTEALTCGDGQVDPGETCDDGDLDDADSCSATCEEQLAVTAPAVGDTHTCALLSGGRIKCWGWNVGGQLGQGDKQPRGDQPGEMGDALPEVDLGEGAPVVTLSAGWAHTCALRTDGEVQCWGGNFMGQLGYGDLEALGDEANEMGNNLPSVALGQGEHATAISAGQVHTCVLLASGKLKCWGWNEDGRLGLGDAVARGNFPGQMGDALPAVSLGQGKVVTQVSAGGYATCARFNDGTIKCWGYNLWGQLGQGDQISRGDQANEMGDALPVVDLGQGVKAERVAVGSSHACALLAGGLVKCWGAGSGGQLGQGGGDNRGDEPGEMGDALPPIDLGAGQFAVDLSAGSGHTCVVLGSGAVKCWGWNEDGELGLGDTASRGDDPGEMGDDLPTVDLGAGRTATAIETNSLYFSKTCARLDDASIKCWGYNETGDLGLGDVMDRGDDLGEMGDALPTVKLFSAVW